jgi:hypothetical protein
LATSSGGNPPGWTGTVNHHRLSAGRGLEAAGGEEAVVVDDVVGVQVGDEHGLQVFELQTGVGECVERTQAAINHIDIVADFQRR